jgi:hypothetical protein
VAIVIGYMSLIRRRYMGLQNPVLYENETINMTVADPQNVRQQVAYASTRMDTTMKEEKGKTER